MAREQKNIVVQTIHEQIRASLKYGDTVYCTDVGATRVISLGMMESPSTFADMLEGSGDETLIGDVAARPIAPTVGLQFYDISLSKPIWYDGADWKDAANVVA